MLISELINPSRTRCCEDASSKKRILEQLGDALAQAAPSLTPGEIFDALVARERLGSTGLGKGIAIPHGRMRGLKEPVGAFIKLAQGVDFDAADDQPVDLIFALLVPESAAEEHLNLLAQIAQMFNDPAWCARLRKTKSDRDLYELLSHWEPHSVPA